MEQQIISLTDAVIDLNERTMMSQTEIDALTGTVQQVASDLTATQQKIQAELDSMEAQILAGTPVTNIAALQAAVAPLDAAVVALGNVTPTPPAGPVA